MLIFNKVWSMWQRKDLNPVTIAEITQKNSFSTQSNVNNLTYHAKQLAKGLLVFGAGLLGYLGFSAFFGSKREANTPEAERVVEGNLAFHEEDLFNEQSAIIGMSTSLEHQESKEFIPTTFSTSRTLLSSEEKKVERDNIEFTYHSFFDAAKADNTAQIIKSTRRAVPPSSYKGGGGAEFRVNTIGSGGNPAVARLTEGGFVVVWCRYEQGVNRYRVNGQRYNSVGLQVGSEFQVSTNTTWSSNRIYPSVMSLTKGGFVVVWQRDDQDSGEYTNVVYAQRYNPSGQPMVPVFQVDVTDQNYRVTAVASLAEGSFVLVWSSRGDDDNSLNIYGQRCDTTGQPMGPKFRVNTYTVNHQFSPDVTSLTYGGFVVVWQSTWQDGDVYGVYGQRYNAMGQAVDPEFQVNTYTPFRQDTPAVTSLTKGGFVVVWASRYQDGSEYGVYGQRYNATGLPDGVEFRVNTYTTSSQEYPAVTAFPVEGFVVVWTSYGQDGDAYGVYGQHYDSVGLPENSEFRVSTYMIGIGRQYSPSVTSLTDRVFVVVYQDVSNVYGRIFSPHTFPTLLKNRLVITQGGNTQITPRLLLAMDRETNNATLLFTVRNNTFGRFEGVNAPGAAITTFIQQGVMNNQIRFVHDGSTNTPYYEIKVSDGSLETAYVPADITFYNSTNNLAPILITSTLLGITCLCVTAAGIFIITAGGIYITKNKKNNRKSLHNIELEAHLLGHMKLSPFLKRFNIDPSEIQLKEKIGQGGEASVYRATWSNKTVAYKLTAIMDPNAISEFEKEAKIMLESNHPNIVHVYRICVTPRRIGLVMEFMALGSLKEAIKKQTITLTWETKWNIAYDLATVIAFLHGKDVVHRDIKTDNLLLYQESGDIHAKLADFGLSKMQQNLEQSVTMGIGTMKYMAPEMVLSNDGKFSAKAGDVYAIGMTFIVLITEEEPYPKEPNDLSIPYRVGNLKLYQEIDRTQCPYAFFKLMNQCRSLDPDKRPTAIQMMKQLETMQEAFATFEENVALSQELTSISALNNRPSSEEGAINAQNALTTQALFSVKQAVKQNPLDDFIGALNKEIEKAQNGKLDYADLGLVESKLEKLESLVCGIRSSLLQQELKEEELNFSVAIQL